MVAGAIRDYRRERKSRMEGGSPSYVPRGCPLLSPTSNGSTGYPTVVYLYLTQKLAESQHSNQLSPGEHTIQALALSTTS
eukprot:2911096-Karenia_brevis.AAC.1